MKLRSAILAEFLGTAGLLVVVVGSGIMGESLSQGNLAITLLANSLATGAGLYVLIQIFGAFSGAHFNPAVSLVEFLWKRLSTKQLGAFVAAQLAGGLAGVGLTHFMFGQSLFQISHHDRSEFRLFVSEILATFGLILVIALSGKKDTRVTPMAIGLYIIAAYWCTSSTSFANPAVTFARAWTDTFSGIAPGGISTFVLAQILGALIGFMLTKCFETSSP